MNCTICRSSNTGVAFTKNDYQILRCYDCDHMFTSLAITSKEVDIIYSDNYFTGGGGGYDDYTVEKEMLIRRGEYYASKMTKFMLPGKVLDVGAAAGFILKGFENKTWTGTGIEPNKTMADYGKNNLGVNIIIGPFETIKIEEKFDLVLLIQVVAHLYDVNSSVNKIFESLKPGGYLLIETWNKDSLTTKFFGENWHEFCPPSTLNYFSKKTLKELMLKHNFSLIDQGTPRKNIHSKHARSLLKHMILGMPGFKWLAGITNLIPGNMVLPYPSEDLFWFLLQKPMK